MSQPLRVLDLFSGIGGFSLGLERAGMQTVAFCEIDPFCRKVLAKHWPHVPCYDDVRHIGCGEIAIDARTCRYVAPGPVPDDAKGVVSSTCFTCAGMGYIECEDDDD
jgi:site-specific DNA-cytosine methylase